MPFLTHSHKGAVQQDQNHRYSYFECTRDGLVQHRYKDVQSQPSSSEDHRNNSLPQEAGGN